MDNLKSILKRNKVITQSYKYVNSLLGANTHLNAIKENYSCSEQGIRRMYRKALHAKPQFPLRVHGIHNSVEIEINNYCNLNCIMCNTGAAKRAHSNMEMSTFENSIKFLYSSGTRCVNLYTVGEPLVNPQLEEYFDLLRKYNMKTQLSTNAQLLDKKLELLIKNADLFTGIRFSLDGATQSTYEKIRYPGKFSKVLDNLDLFTKENEKGNYFPNVLIDSIVSKDVKDELAYHLNFYSRYTKMSKIGLHLVNGLSLDNRYFFENSILTKHIVPMYPCPRIFGDLHILVNGDVTACCRDYDGDLIYGNINQSSNNPDEILNSEKIIEMRKMHIEGNIPSNILCASCYRVAPFVDTLFNSFAHILTLKYAGNWDEIKLQKKFDRFFQEFSEKIPSEDEYLKLF